MSEGLKLMFVVIESDLKPMSKEKLPTDEMQYEQLVQDALRGVIKAAVERAASPAGIPGEHHFYITFKTQAPGASCPADILAKFPDEMTIVLQHQFWDLNTSESGFGITLSFGGQPKRLIVPYTAVTRFFDPSVQFMLQFEVEGVPTTLPDPEPEPTVPPKDDGPKIVSLDQFRKK